MKHRPTHFSLICMFYLLSLATLKASEIPLVPLYKTTTTKKSSELTQTTTQDPITTMLREQIRSIAEDINTSYSKHSDGLLGRWGLGSSTLSSDDMATIVNKIAVHQEKKIIKALLNALYKKNALFKLSVDFFKGQAWNNIQHVTCNTLTTIDNPMQQQPTPALNLLSSVVKLPIIKFALKRIERNYEITLIGHTDKIWSYDICVATGYAVTTSEDKTIRIWDLNNGGICILNFPVEPFWKHDVCFNSTGTHIATIENINCGTSIIRQWKINGQQLDQTHTYESLDGYLEQIFYVDNDADNMIAVIANGNRYTKRCTTIFMFQDDGKIASLQDFDICMKNKI